LQSFQWRFCVASRHNSADGFDSQLSRHLTGAVTTNAVGDNGEYG
jgi:hypothetical protein